MNEEQRLPINLMIDVVFNNFNDDTELLARWLFKNGYVNKNEDGNYIINEDYKPTFFNTIEIKEYNSAFKELQNIALDYKHAFEELSIRFDEDDLNEIKQKYNLKGIL